MLVLNWWEIFGFLPWSNLILFMFKRSCTIRLTLISKLSNAIYVDFKHPSSDASLQKGQCWGIMSMMWSLPIAFIIFDWVLVKNLLILYMRNLFESDNSEYLSSNQQSSSNCSFICFFLSIMCFFFQLLLLVFSIGFL